MGVDECWYVAYVHSPFDKCLCLNPVLRQASMRNIQRPIQHTHTDVHRHTHNEAVGIMKLEPSEPCLACSAFHMHISGLTPYPLTGRSGRPGGAGGGCGGCGGCGGVGVGGGSGGGEGGEGGGAGVGGGEGDWCTTGGGSRGGAGFCGG